MNTQMSILDDIGIQKSQLPKGYDLWHPYNMTYKHNIRFCVHNTESTYNNERKEILLDRLRCLCDCCRGINEFWVEGSLTTNTHEHFPIDVEVYFNWHSNRISDLAFFIAGIYAMMCTHRKLYNLYFALESVLKYRHLSGMEHFGNNFYESLEKLSEHFVVPFFYNLRRSTVYRYKHVFKETGLIEFNFSFK